MSVTNDPSPYRHVTDFDVKDAVFRAKRTIYVKEPGSTLMRATGNQKTLCLPGDHQNYVEAGRIWALNEHDTPSTKRMKGPLADIFAIENREGFAEFFVVRREGLEINQKKTFELTSIPDFPTKIKFASIENIEDLIFDEIGPILADPLLDRDSIRQIDRPARTPRFIDGDHEKFSEIIQALAYRFLTNNAVSDGLSNWLETSKIYVHTKDEEIYFIYFDTNEGSSRDSLKISLPTFEANFQSFVQSHQSIVFRSGKPITKSFKRMVSLIGSATNPISRLRRSSYETIDLPSVVAVDFPSTSSAHQQMRLEKIFNAANKFEKSGTVGSSA